MLFCPQEDPNPNQIRLNTVTTFTLALWKRGKGVEDSVGRKKNSREKFPAIFWFLLFVFLGQKMAGKGVKKTSPLSLLLLLLLLLLLE